MCQELTSLTSTINECSSLTSLVFDNCRYLDHLPEIKASLANLGQLKILGSPKLENLPSGLDQCSLSVVDVSGCSNLNYLPPGLMGLRVLKLNGCRTIAKLPADLPDCEDLELVEMEGVGAEIPEQLKEKPHVKIVHD